VEAHEGILAFIGSQDRGFAGWLLTQLDYESAGDGATPVKRSTLFRSRFHRGFAECDTLGDDCHYPDVPGNGIVIVKLQDDAHDEKQTSQHGSLLIDLFDFESES